MQESKIYLLSLNIEAVSSQSLKLGGKYSLILIKETQSKLLKAREFSRSGRAEFSQRAQFRLFESELNRSSKITVLLQDETDQQKLQIGKMDLFVMNAKNYSQKIWTMTGPKKEILRLEMTVGITSFEKKLNSSLNEAKVNYEELTKKAVSSLTISKESMPLKLTNVLPAQNAINLTMPPFQKESAISSNDVLACQYIQSSPNVEQIKKAEIMPLANQSELNIRNQSKYSQELQDSVDKLNNYDQASLRIGISLQPQAKEKVFQSLQDIKNKFNQIHQKEVELNSSTHHFPIQKQDHTSSKLKICHILNITQIPRELRQHSYLKMRYQLAKENPEHISQSHIGESHISFQEEDDSLNRIYYIKLNKITHLTKTADIAKRRNQFLAKANEELKLALTQAEKKIQLSKNIIHQKEVLIQSEFNILMQKLADISKCLAQKSDESAKKQEKIKGLQSTVEKYARDINNLKAQLKESHHIISNLKAIIANREENETKGICDSKTTREMEESRCKEITAGPIDWKSKLQFTPRNISRDPSLEISKQEEKPKTSSKLNIFRKFSHSKNASYDASDTHSARKTPKNTTDMIFDKLALLCSGETSKRLLQHL